jgi:hypothetical protein
MRALRRGIGLIRKFAPKEAETLALEALAFVAGSTIDLARFVENSGIAPDELRTRAEEPAVLAAVLAFLLSDDERLLAFCAEQGIEPKKIHGAEHALQQARKSYWP